jgi:copper chaperone CopZ
MPETVRLKTTGMHCGSCSMLIEMNVSDLDGVESVTSDFHSGTTEVTYDADKTTPEAITAEIVKAGYGVESE